MKPIDYIQAALAAVIAMLGGIQVLAPILGVEKMGAVTGIAALSLIGLQVFQARMAAVPPPAKPVP